MMRAALLAVMLFPATAAWADTHSVIVRNGGSETIRGIQVGPAGRLGENRMRSQLPPGAEARITYSTGCQADVRLTYASGQTEDHAGLDVCSDPRVVAGTAGAASVGSSAAVTPAAMPAASPALAKPAASPALAKPAASTAEAKPAAAAAGQQVAKTPVPPWSGRSITRRFGGME